jgi:hypothetical protein
VLLTRALTLDEAWSDGTTLLGGSTARARGHFDRAVALTGGQSAFAYVTLATSVAAPARDRADYEKVLKQALAVDVSKRPAVRLANLIAQRRAKFLLANADRMFR